MRGALFALLLAISFVNINTAAACSCVRASGTVSAQVAEAVAESAAVFSAEVIEVEEFMAGVEQFQEAKLKVIERWKGPHAVGTVVKTATQTACCLCGLKVAVGQTLLVYVYDKPPYELSTCSRTRPLNLATEDIKALGKAKSDAKASNAGGRAP